MTGSAAEFRRAMRHAFGEAATETGGGVRLAADGARLFFAVTAAPPLQLGVLRLERLRVEVRVEAGDLAAAGRLLARVDRATQRGGG
jgi:hypothetical protein